MKSKAVNKRIEDLKLKKLFLHINKLSAYSFGNLKSAKSPETVHFAEKNLSYQRNGNSKNGISGRRHYVAQKKCQKNAHSVKGR